MLTKAFMIVVVLLLRPLFLLRMVLKRLLREVLREAGLSPPSEEFKSSARMDSDPRMQLARNGLLALAGSKTKVAVFFGPFKRAVLGKHTLQALQSVVVRNRMLGCQVYTIDNPI